MEGLEPSTYGLTDRRYHQLSYIPISKCPDSNRASASLTRRATITPASRQSEWQVAACQWHAFSNDRSEAETLNLRPRPPEGRVLPDYTTSRKRPVWGPAPSAFLCDRQAATPAAPRIIESAAGYDPVPPVWKTGMLPVTPYRLIGRLRIELRLDAYKTPVLPLNDRPILFSMFRAGDRSRTYDLLLVRQTLSQLRYAGRRDGPCL